MGEVDEEPIADVGVVHQVGGAEELPMDMDVGVVH